MGFIHLVKEDNTMIKFTKNLIGGGGNSQLNESGVMAP